jgi:hypothetical protein
MNTAGWITVRTIPLVRSVPLVINEKKGEKIIVAKAPDIYTRDSCE